MNKYWTICPLYTEFKTIMKGKVKLPFYTMDVIKINFKYKIKFKKIIIFLYNKVKY